ncbi:Vacuolar protein sorting-associated protein 26C [Saguinus oedipus]|uniref:Vacuolar protein sorting-associated protein 26C n=1 Tax=Saguinus oedipus TaxID=9490 RepID=A0ABQ9TZ19_SAGOE|nr:Vacuolar protein sorting-associated protein 26C [Saguinus oedipus]
MREPAAGRLPLAQGLVAFTAGETIASSVGPLIGSLSGSGLSCLQEVLSGVVVISSKDSVQHQGVSLTMEGTVNLQLSAKSVGVFEAFYNSVKAQLRRSVQAMGLEAAAGRLRGSWWAIRSRGSSAPKGTGWARRAVGSHPIQIINSTIEMVKPGKFPSGKTEIPFEFPLHVKGNKVLYETYHGVFVNIQYTLRCDMRRSLLAKDLTKTCEFIVHSAPQKGKLTPSPVDFTITPETLQNVKERPLWWTPHGWDRYSEDTGTWAVPAQPSRLLCQDRTVWSQWQPLVEPQLPTCTLLAEPPPDGRLTSRPESALALTAPPAPQPGVQVPEFLGAMSSRALLPKFLIRGHLNSTNCVITQPLTGELVVESSEAAIRSVELQLVRVETCGCAEGYARDATEIQNIQIADGDVCRGLSVPIYMVFPRLFTCPTLETTNFKVEFEINIVVLLHPDHLITENFPLKLCRT